MGTEEDLPFLMLWGLGLYDGSVTILTAGKKGRGSDAGFLFSLAGDCECGSEWFPLCSYDDDFTFDGLTLWENELLDLLSDSRFVVYL